MKSTKLSSLLWIVISATLNGLSVQAQETHTYNKMVYDYDDAGNRVSRLLEITEDKIMSEKAERKDTTDFGNTPLKTSLDSSFNIQLTEREVKPHVFPNPSSDYLFIDLLYNSKLLTPSQTAITIRDAKGAIWHERKTSYLRETVDISSLAMGKYILTIRSEKNTYIYNIIKK